MKTVLSFLGATAAVMLFLAGCQTARAVLAQESTIRTDSTGFSPKADNGRNTIVFNLAFGNRDLVNDWKVQVSGEKGVVRSFTGDSSDLPATLSWDGMDDSNNAAPEGTYTASLSVDYAGKAAATASSGSFVLDRTEPAATLSANPAGFTPSRQGVKGPVTISLSARSQMATIQSWEVDVFDPDGRLFQSFTGKGADGRMSWDGKGLAGDWVQPSRTYAALATIRDEYGLAGTARLSIPVADLAASAQPARQ